MKKLTILFTLVFASVTLRAQTHCTDAKALPLIVQQVLNITIVQDALFKEAGRRMYPMYVLYPHDLSPSKFSMEGFTVDSAQTRRSAFAASESVLEIEKFKYSDHSNSYKVKFMYNQKLSISAEATLEEGCTRAVISNVLVYSKTGKKPDVSFSNSPSYEN
jgi:hypothetical protein